MLVPSKRIRITTDLSLPLVKRRIATVMSEHRPAHELLQPTLTSIFQGCIIDQHFSMHHPYRSIWQGYAPFIEGDLYTSEGGTVIEASFHMNTTTYAQTMAIIGLGLVLLLGLMADMIQRRSYDLVVLLFPILLTAVLYGSHLTRFQDAVRYDHYLLLLLVQQIGSDEWTEKEGRVDTYSGGQND